MMKFGFSTTTTKPEKKVDDEGIRQEEKENKTPSTTDDGDGKNAITDSFLLFDPAGLSEEKTFVKDNDQHFDDDSGNEGGTLILQEGNNNNNNNLVEEEEPALEEEIRADNDGTLISIPNGYKLNDNKEDDDSLAPSSKEMDRLLMDDISELSNGDKTKEEKKDDDNKDKEKTVVEKAETIYDAMLSWLSKSTLFLSTKANSVYSTTKVVPCVGVGAVCSVCKPVRKFVGSYLVEPCRRRPQLPWMVFSFLLLIGCCTGLFIHNEMKGEIQDLQQQLQRLEEEKKDLLAACLPTSIGRPDNSWGVENCWVKARFAFGDCAAEAAHGGVYGYGKQVYDWLYSSPPAEDLTMPR